MCGSWAVLRPSWAVLGLSWGPLGPSWSGLGCLLGGLGASGSRNSEKAKNIENKNNGNQRCWPLGALLGGILEASWGVLGAHLGRLGAILGVLGRSFGDWGPSWVIFGASWGLLGPSWNDLGSPKARRPPGLKVGTAGGGSFEKVGAPRARGPGRPLYYILTCSSHALTLEQRILSGRNKNKNNQSMQSRLVASIPDLFRAGAPPRAAVAWHTFDNLRC